MRAGRWVLLLLVVGLILYSRPVRSQDLLRNAGFEGSAWQTHVVGTSISSWLADDWQPWCLRSWLQDLDGDGIENEPGNILSYPLVYTYIFGDPEATLEDTRRWVPLHDDRMPTLMEHYKVPHFDAKGEANALFEAAGVPTTFLLTSFYWDNLIYFGSGPVRGEDGTLLFTLPMADRKMPGIAVEDIGRCALGIFKAGEAYIGRTVGIAGEHLTGEEMAARLGEALGETVRYNAVSPEVYRAFDFPGADDLGNMFQFKRDFEIEFCGARDLDRSRALNPSLQTFRQWLAKYANLIPLD